MGTSMLGLFRCGLSTDFITRLETGESITNDYVHAIFRSNFQNYILPDTFVKSSTYFFRAPPQFAPKALRQVAKYMAEKNATYTDLMGSLVKRVTDCEEWTPARLQEIVELKDDAERPRWTAQMRVVRLALTGGEPGPSVADTMVMLGKGRTTERLKQIEKVVGKIWSM